MNIRLARFLTLAPLILTQVLQAADHHVDIVLGDDLLGNGSALAPWKTLSHALAQPLLAGDRVLLAPGVHTAANGEVFPIVMRPGVSVIGSGAGSTVLQGDGVGGSVVLLHFADYLFPGQAYDAGTLLAELSLQSAATGVRCTMTAENTGSCDPLLRALAFEDLNVGIRVVGVPMGTQSDSAAVALLAQDCVFDQCGVGFRSPEGNVGFGVGLSGVESNPIFQDCLFRDCATGTSFLAQPLSSASPILRDCRFESCGVGSWASYAASGSGGIQRIEDSSFDGCGTAIGQVGYGSGGFVITEAHIDRCTIRDCDTGVHIGLGTARLSGCLIADGLTGLFATGTSFEPATGYLEHSTVTGNLAGISGNAFGSFRFTNSILWGNVEEIETCIDLFGGTTYPCVNVHSFSSWSNLHLPSGLPGTTNIDVDPLFVDPLAGNYHLSSNSPLIDAGDPAKAPGGLDIDFDPRSLDGNLNLVARVDIGHDEFNWVQLSGPATAPIGSTFALDVNLPAGWLPLHGLSSTTSDVALDSFGSLLLDPSALVFLSAATGSTHLVLNLPANPNLAGVRIYFQAVGLDTSSLAGSVSNRFELRIAG